jgi:hypothetical protein
VYDNVEDSDLLEMHLPSAPGPILVTTRYAAVAHKAGGINQTKELLTFNREQSILLFAEMREQYKKDGTTLGLSTRDEVLATSELMDLLGGLAVGIEHMAAYIENDQLTVRQFMDKYGRMTLSIHKRSDTGSNAPHTLDTLWAMSVEQVRGKSSDAFHLLCMLSIVSPDAIPISLFNLEAEEDDWELEAALSSYSTFCGDYEL